MLGDLDQAECHRLAQMTIDDDNTGVLGAGDTAHWFVEAARSAGLEFAVPIPQRIHALREPPKFPPAAGRSRQATSADAALLFAWLQAFHREAVPHDPPITAEQADKAAASGRYVLWVVDDQPVSMAAVARQIQRTAAIGPVYTPPEMRGHGYAGSVTAAVADRIFAEGYQAACLFTDLRNPISNRCYARIGFKPHCDAWHFVRQRG